MDTGTIQNVVTLSVSITALTISTGLAVRQHHFTRSTSRDAHTRTALLSLNAEFRTDAFQQSLDYVMNRLTSEFSPDLGLSRLPLEARAHVCRVGQLYGDYGVLAVLPTADREQILSYVHGRVQDAWQVLQPYAAAERVTMRNTYWSYFENLARLAANADKPTILDRLGLRRYDGTRWTAPAVPSAATPGELSRGGGGRSRTGRGPGR
jgi:hypothetical protein